MWRCWTHKNGKYLAVELNVYVQKLQIDPLPAKNCWLNDVGPTLIVVVARRCSAQLLSFTLLLLLYAVVQISTSADIILSARRSPTAGRARTLLDNYSSFGNTLICFEFVLVLITGNTRVTVPALIRLTPKFCDKMRTFRCYGIMGRTKIWLSLSNSLTPTLKVSGQCMD